MKIQNFYSFNRFIENKTFGLDFNSYGIVLNLLFFDNEINNMFAEIKGLREFRLFFQESIFYEDIDEKHLQNGYYLSPAFIENPYLTPKSIVPFFVECGKVTWMKLSDSEKKEFLIEKWILFFTNLPEHYLLIPKEEIKNKTLALLNIDWLVELHAFKKSITYRKKKYNLYFSMSPKKTLLIIKNEYKKVVLKEFETYDTVYKCDFAKATVEGDLLTLEPKMWQEEKTIIDLESVFDSYKEL